jgi:hypothetical protein
MRTSGGSLMDAEKMVRQVGLGILSQYKVGLSFFFIPAFFLV